MPVFTRTWSSFFLYAMWCENEWLAWIMASDLTTWPPMTAVSPASRIVGWRRRKLSGDDGESVELMAYSMMPTAWAMW